TAMRSDLFSEQIFGGDERNLTKSRDSEFAGDFEVSPDGRSIVFAFELVDLSIQLRVSDGTEAQEPTTTTTTLPTSTSTTTLRGGTSTTTTRPGETSTTTTTLSGVSSTTTTLAPPPKEICGNCVDDDGDGLTDFEDAACCGTNIALS